MNTAVPILTVTDDGPHTHVTTRCSECEAVIIDRKFDSAATPDDGSDAGVADGVEWLAHLREFHGVDLLEEQLGDA